MDMREGRRKLRFRPLPKAVSLRELPRRAKRAGETCDFRPLAKVVSLRKMAPRAKRAGRNCVFDLSQRQFPRGNWPGARSAPGKFAFRPLPKAGSLRKLARCAKRVGKIAISTFPKGSSFNEIATTPDKGSWAMGEGGLRLGLGC